MNLSPIRKPMPANRVGLYCWLLALSSGMLAQKIYIGTTMGFAGYLEDQCGLEDTVYQYTYNILDGLCGERLFPAIVSIGNESYWHRLMPNVPDSDLPEYSPGRSVALHNAGLKAVRDIAGKYNVPIGVSFHMSTPAITKWWLQEHWPYGPDMDSMGFSLYYQWNKNDYAGYDNLGNFVEGIAQTHGIGIMIMETAQLFHPGSNDTHVNALGNENIPPGYDIPVTTDTQKKYLTDITRQVLDHGGLGTIVWGGEWVAGDCYVHADKYGKGSSWENNAFWDFSHNLYDGVNWMRTIEQEYLSGGFHVSAGRYISLYPNAIREGIFFIESPWTGPFHLMITDLSGRMVREETVEGGNSGPLRIVTGPGMDTGAYLLHIRQPGNPDLQTKIIIL